MWEKRLTLTLGWIFRLLLGGLFAFSGFVKGIDPYGTIYKMEDYLGAMGIQIPSTLLVAAVFFLCGYEFLTGIFFLLGSYRRSAPVMAALLMAVMLPLTLWVAVADPVPDCGCFGDAWLISNWATFWKNVLICLMLIWIWKINSTLHWIVTPALQWIMFVATGLFIVIIEFIGYSYQPLIDFRPYKIGTTLVAETADDDSEDDNWIFRYEKDGEVKDFRISDELPDEADGWVFVDRFQDTKTNKSHNNESSKNFAIFTPDLSEDVTREVVKKEGNQVILFMPELRDVAIASSYKTNSLYDWCQAHDVDMIAVASASEEEIAEWDDLSMSPFPTYSADDTSIKEVVRGNPAIIYLSDGKIVWKSAMGSIMIDDFMEEPPLENLSTLKRDDGWILSRVCWVYGITILIIIGASFLPVLVTSRKKKETGE